MIPDKNTVRVQAFGGMDNRTPETRLAPELLRQLVNLEVVRGKLRLRKGYACVAALTAPHSLWSDGARAFCAAGTLHQFDGATATDLSQPIVGPASFETLNGETYFSDGRSTGIIQADGSIRSWGLDSPPVPDLTASASGGLYAGQYQVALTYLMQSGEESGAGLAAAVQVAAGGGIVVRLPTEVPEEAATVAVYVSEANGSTLRLAMGVIAGQTTAVIGTGSRGRELKTQFLAKMPPGTIVRAAHGRIWSVLGDTVTASEPLRYGLTDAQAGWLRWPEPITLFEPVDTGFFIGSASRVASSDSGFASLTRAVCMPSPSTLSRTRISRTTCGSRSTAKTRAPRRAQNTLLKPAPQPTSTTTSSAPIGMPRNNSLVSSRYQPPSLASRRPTADGPWDSPPAGGSGPPAAGVTGAGSWTRWDMVDLENGKRRQPRRHA